MEFNLRTLGDKTITLETSPVLFQSQRSAYDRITITRKQKGQNWERQMQKFLDSFAIESCDKRIEDN